MKKVGGEQGLCKSKEAVLLVEIKLKKKVNNKIDWIILLETFKMSLYGLCENLMILGLTNIYEFFYAF